MSAQDVDVPDLEYSGRDSNRNLSFRRWSASSHASYYTPLALCQLIQEAITAGLIGDSALPVVFDPTCGSGRMLLPFREAGHTVLGVELDEEAAEVAKKNLGSKNVRSGDLLLYRGICKRHEWSEGANVVMTNPPFGLWWHVPDAEGWATVGKTGSVESQAFTIELASDMLLSDGLLVAVLPTSTFTTQKDDALRQLLYERFDIVSHSTIEHLFTAEYGLDVSVDLVIGKRVGYRAYGASSRRPAVQTFDWSEPGSAAALRAALGAQLLLIKLPECAPPPLPQAKLLVSLPTSNAVTLTAEGVTGDVTARAMLDFLNETVMEYSPVQGTRVGVIDAFASRPALIKRGWEAAEASLTGLGFTVTTPLRTRTTIDRLRTRYRRLSVPLYRPQPHQLLGYFDDTTYTAKATVRGRVEYDGHRLVLRDGRIALDNAGKVRTLWQKGASYAIHPTWIRKTEDADVQMVENTAKKRTEKVTTKIDRGYLLLEVQTDAGLLPIAEVDEHAVSLLLEGFDLPEVRDVCDLFSEEVERNRRRLLDESPYLLDYQLEDVARLVTKPRGYLGWEVGGGKTPSSFAWMHARQYRRALVVCEASVAEQWMSEAQKFGVKAHRLATHAQVSDLRRRIAAGEKPSGFYVTTYEFLALDGSRTYVPWTCRKYDKDGELRHEAVDITTERCECGTDYATAVRSCPTCDTSDHWTGAVCERCGFIAYAYDGQRRQSPAYKRIKKLFPCVIADEAQVAKSKLSLRGQALRALNSKGFLLLTATIFKGYVTDLFWLTAHALRWNNPLFPYTYKGGSKRFLACYGTYKFVTREYEDTLHTGKAQMLPEVSSLNLFARMMAPFMVRRVDGQMAELPPKHRHVRIFPMRREQIEVYAAWEGWAHDRITNELRRHEGADVNMGVISQSLWALRFAATVPTAEKHLSYPDGPTITFPKGASWSKLDEVMAITRAVTAAGEKVVIVSPLKPMVAEIAARLKRECVRFTPITAVTPTKQRPAIVKAWNVSSEPVLLAAMGCITRGLNITGANHIIVCAVEWSPESLTQVCGRIHRPGQTKECHEHILLSETTIDVDMFNLCIAKHDALKEAIDGRERYASVADILKRATNAAQLEVARRMVSRPRVERVVPPLIVEAVADYQPVAHTSATQARLF